MNLQDLAQRYFRRARQRFLDKGAYPPKAFMLRNGQLVRSVDASGTYGTGAFAGAIEREAKEAGADSILVVAEHVQSAPHATGTPPCCLLIDAVSRAGERLALNAPILRLGDTVGLAATAPHHPTLPAIKFA